MKGHPHKHWTFEHSVDFLIVAKCKNPGVHQKGDPLSFKSVPPKSKSNRKVSPAPHDLQRLPMILKHCQAEQLCHPTEVPTKCRPCSHISEKLWSRPQLFALNKPICVRLGKAIARGRRNTFVTITCPHHSCLQRITTEANLDALQI